VGDENFDVLVDKGGKWETLGLENCSEGKAAEIASAIANALSISAAVYNADTDTIVAEYI
jgi:hypothetical protein